MNAVLKPKVRELILGCGSRKDEKRKAVHFEAINPVYSDPVTLDIMPEHKPDVVWDLDVLPLPFKDNEFDEIHAYEVLEHCGRQGDWKFFFAQFTEFWRILKPGGYFCASTPMWDCQWAWGDPGHTRIISPHSLMFLDQQFYAEQSGKTAASDYRPFYKGDFEILGKMEKDVNFFFVLRAKK